MKNSEICRQLIMLAYDADPDPDKISIGLGDAMDLYRDLVLDEQGVAIIAQIDGGPLPPSEEEPPIIPAESSKPEPNALQGFEPVRVGGISGRSAVEKRLIYRKLVDYRIRHGLGCLKALSDAARGVSVDEIRTMLDGGKLDLAKWKKVDAAIDKLEGKDNGKKNDQRGTSGDAGPAGADDSMPVPAEG